MASAVNYLMNLPLQSLGFCFLQIKNAGEKCSFRETLPRPPMVFKPVQFHSQLYPQEKSSSAWDLGAEGETLPGELAVTEGLPLSWERMGPEAEAPRWAAGGSKP